MLGQKSHPLLNAARHRLSRPLPNEGGAFDVRGTVGLTSHGVPSVTVAMTPRGGDPAQARNFAVGTDATGNWNVQYRVGPP